MDGTLQAFNINVFEFFTDLSALASKPPKFATSTGPGVKLNAQNTQIRPKFTGN